MAVPSAKLKAMDVNAFLWQDGRFSESRMDWDQLGSQLSLDAVPGVE